MKIRGRIVAVTGGGRGVGMAHALACAREGSAGILLNDLGCDVHGEGSDPSVAETAARAVEELGVPCLADALDVGTREAAEAIVGRTVGRFGRLDAVIASAGLVADATVMGGFECRW